MNQQFHFKSEVDILVVDDTRTNVRVLNRILSEQGYKVRVASNGILALQSVQSNPPDLILLDIKMPGIDGYQVCEHLKADEKTRDIPVIFLSALDKPLDKVTAFAVGGVDYITKPFDVVEVLMRIENQLRMRSLQLQLMEQNAQLRSLQSKLMKQNMKAQLEIKKRLQIEADLRQATLELESNTHLDSLTKVANRRCFDESLAREWQRCKREQQYLSLILCDVDYFTVYQERYGHRAGDNCLMQVAQTIKSTLKRSTDVVARYEQEVLAAILPNTNSSGAAHVAELIRLAVRQIDIPHAQSDVSELVTLSLGVATVVPHRKLSFTTLIFSATEALNKAKQQGGDRAYTTAIATTGN